MKKKTILCISVSKSWGGGEQFILDLCTNINMYNFVIATPDGNVCEKFKNNGLHICKINSLKKIYKTSERWDLISYLNISFNLFLSTINLIKIIAQKKPSLVVANGNFAGLYSFPAALLLRKKLIVVQHLIYTDSRVERFILNILKIKVSFFVAVSKAVADNINSMINDDRKIKVIYNGLRTDTIEYVHEKTDVLRLGVIGSIIRIKGIEHVIMSVFNISSQRKIKLNIFGSATEDKDSILYEVELKSLVDKLKLENVVIFKGHENSKEKIYSEVDVVVVYSLIPEAFSYTAAEAMAYKKIVIATALGGPYEIISDSYDGFLVDAGREDILEEKIKYCIDRFYSDEIASIRANARKTIVEKFSLKKFTKEYEDLFGKLIS